MVRGMTAAKSWYSFLMYMAVSTIAGFRSVQRALFPTLLQVSNVCEMQLNDSQIYVWVQLPTAFYLAQRQKW